MKMQLRYSPTSPYVRKVSVTLIESGLADQVEQIATNPWDPETSLPEQNPLGKVPVLVTAEGDEIFDSHVICEYLDGLHNKEKMVPPSGPARINALRLHALADGILDAAVLGFIEMVRRPEAYRWSGWRDRQVTAIHRSLDWLESHSSLLDQSATIGTIAVGCALGYLDFRFADQMWREGRGDLSSWHEEFSKRASMRETVPKD